MKIKFEEIRKNPKSKKSPRGLSFDWATSTLDWKKISPKRKKVISLQKDSCLPLKLRNWCGTSACTPFTSPNCRRTHTASTPQPEDWACSPYHGVCPTEEGERTKDVNADFKQNSGSSTINFFTLLKARRGFQRYRRDVSAREQQRHRDRVRRQEAGADVGG